MPVVWLLAAAAIMEATTGIALTVVPSTVAWLLLGESLIGAGLAVGRIAGIALLALGLGSWAGRRELGQSPALAAMVSYNVFVAGYLAYVGVEGAQVGMLLWPALAIHSALGLLLGKAWLGARASTAVGRADPNRGR